MIFIIYRAIVTEEHLESDLGNLCSDEPGEGIKKTRTKCYWEEEHKEGADEGANQGDRCEREPHQVACWGASRWRCTRSCNWVRVSCTNPDSFTQKQRSSHKKRQVPLCGGE